ncbi:MAG: hypothetical protein HC919_10605 [Oscillatoriales cyanobacterium SM2_2_1]|nr:hypothetical protein [Oscillatoriales cyanobacterium SM2_2_1]
MQTLSPNPMPSHDEPLPAIASNPALQAALNGLDTTLNDELERYRHWQRNGQTISYLHPFHARAAVPQIVEPILPKRPTAPKAPRNREPELPVTPSPFSTPEPEANPSVLQDLAAVYQSVSYERQQQEPQQELLDSPAEPLTPPNLWRSLLTPVGIGSVMLLLLSSAAIGYVLVDPAGLTKLLQPQPSSTPPAADPIPETALPTFSPLPPTTPPADSFTRPNPSLPKQPCRPYRQQRPGPCCQNQWHRSPFRLLSQ